MTAAIADDTLRKYYRQDMSARLASFFAPAQGPGARPGGGRTQNWRGQSGARQQDWKARRNGEWQPRDGLPPRAAGGGKAAPYVVVSQQLAGSSLHRGHRSAFRAARRSFCRPLLTIPGCCTTTWRNSASSNFAMPMPSGSKAR